MRKIAHPRLPPGDETAFSAGSHAYSVDITSSTTEVLATSVFQLQTRVREHIKMLWQDQCNLKGTVVVTVASW
nr:hypothetical protein [Tanacetum cinerariifolium]